MAYSALRALRENRHGTRFPTKIDGYVRVGSRTLPVTIADISLGGAMITGDELPSRGQRVVLTAIGLDAPGVVMWREQGRCGVSFRSKIQPLDIVRKNTPQLATLTRRIELRSGARV